MKIKFEIGDIVRSKSNGDDLTYNKNYEVVDTNADKLIVIDDVGDTNGKKFSNWELISKGSWDRERFMTYGTKCDNKSDIFDNLKDLKEDMLERTTDSGWTGRILGYKLIPIVEAVVETRLKIFKKSKLVKLKK